MYSCEKFTCADPSAPRHPSEKQQQNDLGHSRGFYCLLKLKLWGDRLYLYDHVECRKGSQCRISAGSPKGLAIRSTQDFWYMVKNHRPSVCGVCVCLWTLEVRGTPTDNALANFFLGGFPRFNTNPEGVYTPGKHEACEPTCGASAASHSAWVHSKGIGVNASPGRSNLEVLALGSRNKWQWLKNRYQNGSLISGNMDQNLRKPSCSILSHTQMGLAQS